MQDKINKKLYNLKDYLLRFGFKKESQGVMSIFKNAFLNIPREEIELSDIYEILEYLDKSSDHIIYLDNPRGSIKFDNNLPLPFHYGEYLELINPSDDMGWDIIIVPSTSDDIVEEKDGEMYIASKHQLVPVGYIPINDDEEKWELEASKKPPIGNDKIILSQNAKYNDDDKNILTNFFDTLWQFKKIVWL